MKKEIETKIKNIIEHNGDWSGDVLQDEINELLIMQRIELLSEIINMLK
jgi:hypothetical protein